MSETQFKVADVVLAATMEALKSTNTETAFIFGLLAHRADPDFWGATIDTTTFTEPLAAAQSALDGMMVTYRAALVDDEERP